ncbi:BTB/POZ domain-containing protein 17-like [Amphiura filiformis]|uniref:BTB/POZ domain-containing protein 17-like n=1 Tax=Amphiura filiformis TaxID=82378 RepID=UPI003B226ACC
MARKASEQEFIEHKTNIIANIGEHFNNADISDVTLTVGEQVFPTHRFVLATQSKVFKTMLMSENWKESEERKITLQESPEGEAAFSDFLKFLYTGNLTLTIDNVCGIHTLADKYDVPTLKDDCVGFMKDVLTGIHGDALKAGLLWLQYVESFLSDMVALCYSTIRTNFTNIYGKEYKTLFWKLTYDQVNNVLSVPDVQEELVLINEEELFNLIDKGKWAKRLLPFVRFHNIDYGRLQTFKSSNILTKHYNEAYKIHAEWANIASREIKKRRLSDGSVEVKCSCGTNSSQTCPHINPRLYFNLPFGEHRDLMEESVDLTIKVEPIDLSDVASFSQRVLDFTGDKNRDKVWKCTLQTDYSGDPICERYAVKPAKSHVGKHFTLAIVSYQLDEEGNFEKYEYVIKYTGVVTMSGEETNTIMLTSPLRFKGSWDMREKAGVGITVLLHK